MRGRFNLATEPKVTRFDRFGAQLFGPRFTPYWLVAPVILVFAFLMAYPLVKGFEASLTNLRAGRWGQESFVGLSNYTSLFKSRQFYRSLGITLTFAGMCLVAEMGLGLGLALLLTRKLRGITFFRGLFIIPFMVPVVVCGLIWRQLLDVQGVVNYLLGGIGLGGFPWLSSASTVLPSILLIDVWQTTPQVMLVLFAGLLTIPKDLHEAAIVDGAGPWVAFRNITIPFLMPYFLVALMIRAIELLQVLDIILVVTLGGPEDASLVLHLYAYRQTFYSGFLGFGAAAAYVLGFIIIFFCLLIARRFQAAQAAINYGI